MKKFTYPVLWVGLFLSFIFASLNAKEFHQKQYKPGPRFNGSPISPWIERKGNIFVYKFNVFNLTPNLIDQKTLKSILKANAKDINKNYAKEIGTGVDIRLYGPEDLFNPKLFKGNRIPMFLVDNNTPTGEFLGFHSNQAVGPANTESFIWAGANIATSLGITIPSNFPAWTPYAAVNFQGAVERTNQLLSFDNPYAFNDPQQFFSAIINHEIKEILGDDSIQNWVVFDTFAPTVATWHFAVFGPEGNVLNGSLGSDGHVQLPLFSDVFPAGGLLTTFQENGDPVSFSVGGFLNSYKVDGWSMTNNPNSNFWKGYYLSDKVKWDYKGYVENPLQPFTGLHEFILFLDFSTGITFFGEVVNYGPVTYSQRGDLINNNFPPDYTFISFFGDFIPTGAQLTSLTALTHE